MQGEAVRLYGISKTNTSWGRVTEGVREGLKEAGVYAGYVPLDDLQEDSTYSGYDAPVAVYVGPPSMVAVMTSYGEHQRRYAILAPNSSWLPEQLVGKMQEYATVVAPSTWGARVVERYTGVYVEPYLHGVASGFVRSESFVAPSLDRFRVLHLASTWKERKGTAELVEGWRMAVSRGDLGGNPRLDVVVDAPEGTFNVAGEKSIFFPVRQLNFPTENMALIYRAYDLVCQPSRAEGFGLVPLEARACGVPVCATDCTGHADHVHNGDPGVVVVATGGLAPVDDAPLGERSEAPSLDAHEVAEALVEAYQKRAALAKMAYDEAPVVAREWSWRAVTEQWLRKESVFWSTGKWW